MKRKILYIAGYGRSGSTLLDSLLGNHEHAFGGGELFFLWQYLKDNRDCTCGQPMKQCPFWASVVDRLEFRLEIPEGNLPYDEFENVRSRLESKLSLGGDLKSYKRVMTALCHAVLDEAGAAMLVDSSKSCRWATHRAKLLAELDDFDFRMIHLVRHPQAVMWSSGRGRNEQMKTVEGAKPSSSLYRSGLMTRGLAGWTLTNRNVDRMIRQMHRTPVLRVKYEDLASDPIGSLKRISHFAEIPLDDVISKVEQGQILEVGHGVGGNRMRQKPVTKIRLDDQWTTSLPLNAKCLSAVSVPLMKRYGYEFGKSPAAIQADSDELNSKSALRRPVVWHIAGEDAHVRIPSLVALRELGYDVGVCGSCEEKPFADAGIPFYKYPVKRFVNPLTDRKSIRALTELMKQHKPDIVHGFSTKPSLFTPQAAARSSTPVNIRTVTGMGYLFSANSLKTKLIRPVYRSLQRRVAGIVDATVFQNSDDKSYFIERGLVDSAKTVLIPGSGVEPARFVQTDQSRSEIRDVREELGFQDKRIVLMVTRLVKSKGVNDFLSAAMLYQKRNQNPDVQFVLIGPLATEGSQAVPLAEIEAASSAVRYLGRREDIVTFMQMADAFVLPTLYREGIPRVLLEAASAQTPIVTTDMPGCREVVTHGETGLLVRREDPEAIADAVESLLSNESLKRKVTEAALLRVHQRFAFEQVVSRYDELYRQLLQQKNVSAWPSLPEESRSTDIEESGALRLRVSS